VPSGVPILGLAIPLLPARSRTQPLRAGNWGGTKPPGVRTGAAGHARRATLGAAHPTTHARLENSGWSGQARHMGVDLKTRPGAFFAEAGQTYMTTFHTVSVMRAR